MELRGHIEPIINEPGASWGPKYVAVVVETADGDTVSNGYGTLAGWDYEAWGDCPHFLEVALAKLETVKVAADPASAVGEYAPFLLPKGGCLWRGAVSAPGIWVAASGLTQEADVAVATVVLDAFRNAAKAEIARRLATGQESEIMLR